MGRVCPLYVLMLLAGACLAARLLFGPFHLLGLTVNSRTNATAIVSTSFLLIVAAKENR